MTYTKTNWVNGQAPAISAENLNNIENGIKDLETSVGTKLSVSAVKTSNTTSDNDTYSCTYINNELNKKANSMIVSTNEFDTGIRLYGGTIVWGKEFILTNVQTGYREFSHGITDFGNLFDVFGSLEIPDGNNPINRVVCDNISGAGAGIVNIDSTKFATLLGSQISTTNTIRIIIMYTKSIVND